MGLEYQVGGPINYKEDCYIERTMERRVLRQVDRKKFVTIVSPRQVGKTSLLQKIQAIKAQQGHATALIDMSTMNPRKSTFENWSSSFTSLIQDCLSHFIEPTDKISPPEDSGKFIRFWEDLASKINARNVLILMDEASSVPDDIRDAFYSTIRWIFTDRSSHSPSPNLSKLNFIFAGVFEPERLIKDGENSPFNISQIFRLPDFSKQESGRLLRLMEHELDIELPDLLLELIFEKACGHPYITQAIASNLYEDLKAYPHLILDEREIEAILERGIEDASDNIDHTGKTVLKYRKSFLIENTNSGHFHQFVIDNMISGKEIPFTRALPQIAKLELFGAIVKSYNGNCQFRNPIVETTLKKLIPNRGTINFRDLDDKITKAIRRIKELLADRQIKNAFSEAESELLELIENVEDFYNSLTLLKSRYRNISDLVNSGTIEPLEASKEENKITLSLIALLDSIKKTR